MGTKVIDRNYRRVPNGSKIFIKLTELTGSTYFINGYIKHRGVEVKKWSAPQLRNATRSYTFQNSGQHVLNVFTSFTGAQTARVEIEVQITKPDGTRHSEVWKRTMSGKNEDVWHAVVNVSVRP